MAGTLIDLMSAEIKEECSNFLKDRITKTIGGKRRREIKTQISNELNVAMMAI